MANMSDYTTINVSEETRDILKSLGKKGDTYEDILRKLIKVYEEEQKW